MSDRLAHVALVALQRVIVERPPAGSLRRGLVTLPPALAAGIVVAALAAVAGAAWIRKRRKAR